MDQEVSRSTWLGTMLTTLVASIAVIIVVYGIARTVSLGYIDNLAKTLLDSNYSELMELRDGITPMSKSAVVGLVERNKTTVKKVTIHRVNNTTVTLPNASKDLTALTLNDQLTEIGNYTTYNTEVEINLDLGTAELKIYVGK